MTAAPAIKPPAHLKTATKAWYKQVCRDYTLEPHHLRLLTLAAEAWDRATEARELIAVDGMVVRDRFGTPRKHPAITIEEQARLAFARIIRQLDLEGTPDALYRR